MTPTIETKIAQAIQARVATIALPYPVIWTDDEPAALPNAGGQPSPYIEAHHEPNRTVRRIIKASAPHERPGLLLLTLCWPISKVGTGAGKTYRDAIREIAGQMATHFPAGLCMSFQGVGVNVTKAPDVLGAYRDDAYVRTQVRVDLRTYA